MMAEGLPIEECVSTIAATLPVCSVRGVAYSTFTIMHIINNETAEIIQYDNPQVIIVRNGVNYEYPKTELSVGDKKIFKSPITSPHGPIVLNDGSILWIGNVYEKKNMIEKILGFKNTANIEKLLKIDRKTR